ncbi:protein Flattop [Strigops habroptila]|uniref:Protein Flattop n=1 Tax=Strigops habroptila TaxID=2489341 RepID=A0A672UW59_STRHB|nr:protein Flattop [Strigops habroptila]
MAAGYGAGQYEDAFGTHRLQNWSVPLPGPKPPKHSEGSTPIVVNDRGHLLPSVPRSQASPWGSFVGTWEMPSRIPPAWVDLTARSAAATERLLHRIQRPTELSCARNGLRTRVTGTRKPSGNGACPDAKGIPELPAPPSHPEPQSRAQGAEEQRGVEETAPGSCPDPPRHLPAAMNPRGDPLHPQE